MSDQDICVFKYVNDYWLQVQIFEQNGCEKESAFEANCSQASTSNCSVRRWGKKAVKNQNERLGGPLMSRRRDITVEEENMALNAPLPRPFCKEHLPDHCQDMTLMDPRGEVWGVRFYVNQTHQVGQLTVGWRKVSFTNNIEASDVCIFELVKPDEFKLHIFRVVEETTPLKRQHDI
ncbi:hypothetical protein MKW92_016351 [Papaver armeniacum]|nr:hypothetical protein MKW92_016351 [Papaver armeniacum]